MGMFGWSYPPGAAGDPNAPWNQGETPCEVCGKDLDDCVCTECPKCGEYGNPICYEQHGMVRTEQQIAAKKAADEANEKALQAEHEYFSKMPNEEM